VPYIESLRHIMRNSMGITYCMWFKNGLFMSMLESNNRWGPPFLLSDMATADFSAVMDEEESISTVFVDYSGRLLLIRACEEKKEPMVLLESRIVGSAPYNVCLLSANEQSHVFYTVSHNRKQLLTYQRVEGSSFSMPEVMGVVVRESKNYAACTEGSNLHLFFITDIQDVSLIVHRKIGSDGKPLKPNSSPFPHKAAKRLQSVCAKDGIIYVLASGDEGDNTVLYRFDTIGCKFSKGLEVYTPSTGPGFDSLLLINNSPAVVRTCKSEFILSRIKPDATEVLDETRIDLNNRDSIQRCVYLSNHKDDRGFKAYEIPVVLGNGLRFPFDWRTLASTRFDKADDEKTKLKERILDLEGRVAFLESTIREMLRP